MAADPALVVMADITCAVSARMMSAVMPGMITGTVGCGFVNDYRLRGRRWGWGLLDDDRFAVVVFVAGGYRRSDNCGAQNTR